MYVGEGSIMTFEDEKNNFLMCFSRVGYKCSQQKKH